jgi:hypothetical protein
MTPPDLHRIILSPLQLTGAVYMVTGGVAAIAYGEPRLTNDVDIVISRAPGLARALASAFPGAAYYVPPDEVLERELARPRHGHFNIIHNETGLRADLYVAGDDSLHSWAMERRHAESIAGEDVWFAPIEYVIVRKLEYYVQGGSDRHLRDIAAMLRISADLIDNPSLQAMIDSRGLHEGWERARRSGFR